jgi:protein-tyrosine phosphatase
MNILFVCTGNTCRSCMAEAIFNSINDDSSLRAFSAGVHIVTGSKTSKNSAKIVFDNLNSDIADRSAVQLSAEHIQNADLILTMTGRIKELLRSSFPQFSDKIDTINTFIGVDGDVIDPYGGSLEVYEKTYSSLKKSIVLLLAKLKEDMSIN